MNKNGKDTKHTRHIVRIINFVTNGEELNIHKIVWFEGGLQLAGIGTNNFRLDEFDPRLGYATLKLDGLYNICTIGLI